MAKGTESKQTIFAKLQEVYPNAFWEDQDKVLRIPLNENGTRVEIKVSLTAAKTNLGGDELESAFSSAAAPASKISTSEPSKPVLEPTEEEKANIAKMIAALGL